MWMKNSLFQVFFLFFPLVIYGAAGLPSDMDYCTIQEKAETGVGYACEGRFDHDGINLSFYIAAIYIAGKLKSNPEELIEKTLHFAGTVGFKKKSHALFMIRKVSAKEVEDVRSELKTYDPDAFDGIPDPWDHKILHQNFLFFLEKYDHNREELFDMTIAYVEIGPSSKEQLEAFVRNVLPHE